MKTFRWVLLALVAFVAIAVIVLVLTAKKDRQIVRLLDGTEVSLEAVTFGKSHRFVYGRGIARVLSYLPEKSLGLWIPPRSVVRHKGDTETLLCWFRFRNTPALPQYRFYVTDDSGVLIDASGYSFSSPQANGEHVEGRGFPVFPRRGDFVKVQLYRQGGSDRGEPVAEFKVKNPVPGPFAEWTASPLPVSVKQGDLQITLTKLLCGVDRSEKPAADPVHAWTAAEFRIEQDGRSTDEWKVEQIQLTDATGNSSRATSWSTDSSRGLEKIFFRPSLWPDEPAWKVRAEFSRRKNFPAADLWTVTNIAVPPDDGYTAINFTNTIAGTTLHVTGLVGERGAMPAGSSRMLSGATAIQVQAEPYGRDRRLTLVEVRDDQNRVVPLNGFASSVSGGTTTKASFGFGLRIPEDAKSLNATFAFHGSRFAEFIAKPEQPPALNPPARKEK